MVEDILVNMEAVDFKDGEIQCISYAEEHHNYEKEVVEDL